MGEAEWFASEKRILIRSDFYFYGEAASVELSEIIAKDISENWNESGGLILYRGFWTFVQFEIHGFYEPEILPETILKNTNPRNNYFRIEVYSGNDISFVDGIGANTGYFKLDNLLHHSTTAAHEYGHSLGLKHPPSLDIRGIGQPGIMYPRGTICDPAFQYDSDARPLQPGGTLNPQFRRVLPSGIDSLRLQRLSYNKENFALVGDFTSLFHEKHLPPISF
jgi:hypothetical protein